MSVSASKSTDAEKTRIMLGLLESVDRGEVHSQRRLAMELGVALGLVNAYLKKCVTKGLVKVNEAPARRYAYYLTPRGFAEKSRLTVEYLSSSLSLFRQARKDCSELLGEARKNGVKRIALLGISDLAEIATICALESEIKIVYVVDAASSASLFAGVPVKASLDGSSDDIDAVMVTDIQTTQAAIAAALANYDESRVLVPALLGGRPVRRDGVAS